MTGSIAVAGETLQRAFVLQDQFAHLSMIFAKHPHDFLRLRGFGEGGEAAQVQEDDGDFAPVGLERIFGAAGDDQLGELRREKALEAAQPLKLGHLLAYPLLQSLIPF